jgi:hypothetical protein
MIYDKTIDGTIEIRIKPDNSSNGLSMFEFFSMFNKDLVVVIFQFLFVFLFVHVSYLTA